MDDSIPDPRGGAYTEITVRIPDDLARRLGTVGEIERRALEALALEEFRLGHLTKPERRRLLGFGTRAKLDEFLKAHAVFGTYTLADLERERPGLQRLRFCRRAPPRLADTAPLPNVALPGHIAVLPPLFH